MSVALVLIYLVLITAESARLADRKNKLRALPLAMILFMVFNLVYPIGQFVGYFKALGYFMRGKKF